MACEDDTLSIYTEEVEGIREAGLLKGEAPVASARSVRVVLKDGCKVINMYANSYLGLGNNQRLIDAARKTYDDRGYSMAPVRFTCGTQDIYKQLGVKISGLLGIDDTIPYSSCLNANSGLFETLLTDSGAVISDELNHTSIIDGVRLCKVKRYRYRDNNMVGLEERLKETDAVGARTELIAADGVSSMDGIICNLKDVCGLADQYNALIMVDDSHAISFIGRYGRDTTEYNDVEGCADIITGTFGRALGGALGGYTPGRKEAVDLLHQRSRPYLFPNTLASTIAGASLELLDMLEESTAFRNILEETTIYCRKLLADNGFGTISGTHLCVPVMLYGGKLAGKFARKMMEKDVYVAASSFPVVPKGKARVHTQICVSHTKEDVDFIVKCFMGIREEMGLS